MAPAALEFESKAVQLYTEALEVCSGDRALVVLLEDILLEEQDGVDHISKLLRDHGASGAGVDSATKAG